MSQKSIKNKAILKTNVDILSTVKQIAQPLLTVTVMAIWVKLTTLYTPDLTSYVLCSALIVICLSFFRKPSLIK